MNTTVNIVLYILAIGSVLYGQLIVGAIFALWYSFRVSPAWLLPAAFLIDGYFGAFYDIPWFSIITIIVYGLIELARPYFNWHTKETV